MSFAYLIFWRINQNAYLRSFPDPSHKLRWSEVRSICLSKVLKTVMLDYLLQKIIICNDVLTLLITYQNFIFGPSIFMPLNSISYEWIVYFSLVDGLLLLILIFLWSIYNQFYVLDAPKHCKSFGIPFSFASTAVLLMCPWT